MDLNLDFDLDLDLDLDLDFHAQRRFHPSPERAAQKSPSGKAQSCQP